MENECKRTIRCAIYTRKSSEEGLDQSFNSLDAQRESCEAFIASQRAEGWRPLSTRYDDGGYSGANMERPALQRLLENIDAKRVDTIVVYKIDRLTRSLLDFAKIVEVLDARGVSFVSITQQFNTTTPMGRLTLNILLSFAQFEREVTGERIRDKIAASKRKGMWMGGRAPVGYDVKEKKLVVNAEEADVVRELYTLYLELGCVSKLKARLDSRGTKSKLRVSANGLRSGGAAYSRGALYRILQNRIYLGEIPHRGQSYPGEHVAVVPRELWERVQERLRSDNQGRRTGIRAKVSNLLVGLIYDASGNRFTPSQTLKNGKRYRYYVRRSSPGGATDSRVPVSVPAHEVETQVLSRLKALFESQIELIDRVGMPEDSPVITKELLSSAGKLVCDWKSCSPTSIVQFVRRVVTRVLVRDTRLDVIVSRSQVRQAFLVPNVESKSVVDLDGGDQITLESAIAWKRCGAELRMIVPAGGPSDSGRKIPSLLKAVARAHDWYECILSGAACGPRDIAQQTNLSERYVSRVLRCAFLAPDIIEAILDGRQPPDLTVEKLCSTVTLNWAEQRQQLGFPAVRLQ